MIVPQSIWCFLGLHRFIFINRYQRYEGLLYELTYSRCKRPGCTRYPEWRRVDVSRVKR